MEKFSRFRDPFHGINPFMAPKYRRITPCIIIRALGCLPLYILFLFGFPVILRLFKIRLVIKAPPRGLVYANSATELDRSLIESLFDLTRHKGTALVFPEGSQTNNMGVLKYDKDPCDYVIGLKYSPECIRPTVNQLGCRPTLSDRILWLVRFLGTQPTVEVRCHPGTDLPAAAGLPQLTLTADDHKKFLEYLNHRQ